MSRPTPATDDHAVIDPPTACSLCGESADDPLAVLTWSLEVEDDGHRWLCLDCARDHVRDIEGRLAIDWWAVGGPSR